MKLDRIIGFIVFAFVCGVVVFIAWNSGPLSLLWPSA